MDFGRHICTAGTAFGEETIWFSPSDDCNAKQMIVMLIILVMELRKYLISSTMFDYSHQIRTAGTLCLVLRFSLWLIHSFKLLNSLLNCRFLVAAEFKRENNMSKIKTTLEM